MLSSTLDRPVRGTAAVSSSDGRDLPRHLPTVVSTTARTPAATDLVFQVDSEAGFALAAARADVIRIGFSRQVPTVTAAAGLVAALAAEILAVGRDPRDVTILLDVEVRVMPDEASARAKRTHLADLDALAGLSWSPKATRVVGVGRQVVDGATRLAAQTGADGVVLVPLSPATDLDRLHAMVG